jgi:regulator of sigma E protease
MGTPYLIILVSLISINLAVVNVLPIPALDGGRLFFLAIETVRGKPLKKRTVNLAHMVGFALLMGLIIAVTFHDVWKIFAG